MKWFTLLQALSSRVQESRALFVTWTRHQLDMTDDFPLFAIAPIAAGIIILACIAKSCMCSWNHRSDVVRWLLAAKFRCRLFVSHAHRIALAFHYFGCVATAVSVLHTTASISRSWCDCCVACGRPCVGGGTAWNRADKPTD